jgi:hypothetical protein
MSDIELRIGSVVPVKQERFTGPVIEGGLWMPQRKPTVEEVIEWLGDKVGYIEVYWCGHYEGTVDPSTCEDAHGDQTYCGDRLLIAKGGRV